MTMKIFRQTFSPIQVNTYILQGEGDECIIIDCGCYDKSEEDQMEAFIESNRLSPVMLINTHCHLDHVFGNAFIFNRYGLKTRADKNDYYNLTTAPDHARLFGLSMENPPAPGESLTDNEKIVAAGIHFEALSVPGHTSGSMAFYFPAQGAVFTGDALFAGSIGRTDLEGGNYETLIKSIKTKLFTLPDETMVYPGHGPGTTIGREKKTNPFFV